MAHVDRRDQFVRALWAHAESLRSDEYQQASRLGCITAHTTRGAPEAMCRAPTPGP